MMMYLGQNIMLLGMKGKKVNVNKNKQFNLDFI